MGESYDGEVVNITKFDAFVNILPGRDGLLHISKMGGGRRVNQVEDVLSLGDSVQVVVRDDDRGKVSLTSPMVSSSSSSPVRRSAPGAVVAAATTVSAGVATDAVTAIAGRTRWRPWPEPRSWRTRWP